MRLKEPSDNTHRSALAPDYLKYNYFHGRKQPESGSQHHLRADEQVRPQEGALARGDDQGRVEAPLEALCDRDHRVATESSPARSFLHQDGRCTRWYALVFYSTSKSGSAREAWADCSPARGRRSPQRRHGTAHPQAHRYPQAEAGQHWVVRRSSQLLQSGGWNFQQELQVRPSERCSTWTDHQQQRRALRQPTTAHRAADEEHKPHEDAKRAEPARQDGQIGEKTAANGSLQGRLGAEDAFAHRTPGKGGTRTQRRHLLVQEPVLLGIAPVYAPTSAHSGYGRGETRNYAQERQKEAHDTQKSAEVAEIHGEEQNLYQSFWEAEIAKVRLKDKKNGASVDSCEIETKSRSRERGLSKNTLSAWFCDMLNFRTNLWYNLSLQGLTGVWRPRRGSQRYFWVISVNFCLMEKFRSRKLLVRLGGRQTTYLKQPFCQFTLNYCNLQSYTRFGLVVGFFVRQVLLIYIWYSIYLKLLLILIFVLLILMICSLVLLILMICIFCPIRFLMICIFCPIRFS